MMGSTQIASPEPLAKTERNATSLLLSVRSHTDLIRILLMILDDKVNG